MIAHFSTTASVDLSSLQSLARQEILPRAGARDRSSQFPLEIFVKLHSLGWLQSAIPQDLGGAGASATDLACISSELAFASTGVATSFVAHTLGMSPIILFGTREQKQKLIAPCAAKPDLWSFCMTEPDSGTDIHASRTIARRSAEGYVLEGKKCFITNADFAEHFVVFARTENADPASPLTAFYVPAHSPGISLGRPLDKMGTRESDTGEVFFDGVKIPEAFRIGGEGQGIAIAFRALHRSKMLLAACAVGTSRRALAMGTEFLSNRVHYGKPLLALPTIRCLLAGLHTEVDAAWLLTCLAAATWESGESAIKEASMAKIYAADAAVKVTSEVLELMGGYGFSREYDIERLYRDAKLYEILEGGSFVQQTLISKELFPKSPSTSGKRRAA
jgi:alkylation response protein AidB-like acyl-CoA dehydrogenase